MTCLFCGSQSLRLLFSQKYHPLAQWHGPFDFYCCNDCGSGVTLPLPSRESLSLLYQSFNGGMMPQIRELRDRYPLTAWFNQCVNRAITYSEKRFDAESVFNWIDFGAGSGELTRLMNQRYPLTNGVAVDFHSRPAEMAHQSNTEWVQADLNVEAGSEFPALEKADFIFFITVLEHLLRPEIFLGHALRLLKPGGCFYLTTPRLDCMAFRIMRGKWPYLIMGEHINMPSIRGMESLLFKLCDSVFGKGNFILKVKPVILPYPAGYFAEFVGLGAISKVFPDNLTWRIPTGLLEASIMFRAPGVQY